MKFKLEQLHGNWMFLFFFLPLTHWSLFTYLNRYLHTVCIWGAGTSKCLVLYCQLNLSALPAYFSQGHQTPPFIGNRLLLLLQPNPCNVHIYSCGDSEPWGGPGSKEKRWKRLNCFVVSSLQDGPWGDPGHGRGSVRREGGCVVTWHYLHRAG